MAQQIWHIRKAKVEDIDAILGLIIDLADYEHARDSAQATPELIRKNLFEKQFAHAFLAFTGTAEAPGHAVGLALWFFNFSTWTGKPGIYLEDLFVTPEARGWGIGKALFGELGKEAEANDCSRIDWSVLKWNQPSIDFYEKVLGAEAMSEWQGMRLTTEGIKRLEKFRK
ncbi:acyl-CoA N-acyltransferase [Exidia glandulosa HHB12029]|uniref:Acyl-CoA N-acyltransferase n=1 Tax=Exidia glandulosa HHB12029 TaxID=1314781 RepID=A0A165PE60_EXIGL|nr:acyl-CoA N-acyltransferase [Exidia glandulosa HHB12029]